MVLNKEDLLNVIGGSSSGKIGLGIIITAVGTFIIGLIDGFLRPLKCN